MSNTNFPTNLDTNPGDPSGSQTLASAPHSTLHGFAQDAIIAIETYIGKIGSAVTTTLTYLLTSTSSIDPGHKHTTASISGTVSPAQGGTGSVSPTAHGVVIAEGTSAMTTATPGAAGTVLTSNGVSADPTFQTLSSAYLFSQMTAAESIASGAAVAAGYYQSDGGIQIDVASGATVTGSSGNYSQSIAIGGGHSNTALFVLIRYRANTGTISSVPQWNGVNMTQISLTDPGGSAGHIYGAYILNPSTGTHNLTWSAANGSDVACLSYWSLYNVAQTGTIDNSASYGAANTGTPLATMTPNAIGAFVLAYGASNSYTGGALTWENNVNLSGTGTSFYSGDANKAFPISPYTVTIVGSGGGICGLISIAPYTPASLGSVVNASASQSAATYADNFSGYRTNSFMGFSASVSTTTAGNLLNVATSGYLATLLSGLIAGVQYYLGNTGGTVSTSAGTVTRKVGIAAKTTDLIITNIW